MKGKILKYGLLSGLVLGCSAITIASVINLTNSGAVKDYGSDLLNASGERIDLKKIVSTGEIEYSKTFVQYAEIDNVYYLRCATAIKGEGVESLTYSRSAISNEDLVEKEAKDINVKSVYKYLISDDKQAYYDGTDLVYEETEATKEYYWACYTVKFETTDFYASDFSVDFSINGETTENTRTVNLTTLVSENPKAFSETATRFDEEYHYFGCLEAGFESLEKKAAHDKQVASELVEPTLTTDGATPHITCTGCAFEQQAITLPALNDVDYDVSYSTGNVDGVVCDTIVYTFKDASVGPYEFVVAGEELKEYIHAGSSYYSIERWNQIFTNQLATVTETGTSKELTITLKEGTTTNITASDGVSPLDGMLDFTLYEKVTVTGNGTLNVTYSTLQDGINANIFDIDEGSVVNLTGFSTEDKSGIKVYKELIVDGEFNISNFGYGQAITKDQAYQIFVKVGETGKYTVTNAKYGIYSWSSTQKYPNIRVLGQLDISTEEHAIYLEKPSDISFENNAVVNINSSKGYGIYNIQGSVLLRDSAKVTINSYLGAIRHFNNLIVGNGDNANTTQNQASLKITCINDDVIKTYTSAKTGRIVFNSTGEIVIDASASSKSKTGIQFSNKSQQGLTIKTTNMKIIGAANAIGAWVTLSSFTTDYNYESPNNKLSVVNCGAIYNSGYNNSNAFGPLTAETVNVVTE